MNYNAKNQMSFDPLEVLFRRKWQLAGCLALVCVMAVATVTVFAPKYEAMAQVKVNTDGKSATSTLGILLGGDSSFSSQLELLKSDKVYEMALMRVNSDPTIVSPISLRQLREYTRLRPDTTSGIIKIVGLSEDAQKAAAIANNLTMSFTETSNIMKSAQTNLIMEQLAEQVSVHNELVSRKEKEIDDFRRDNMIFSSGVNTSEKVVTDLQARLQSCNNQQTEINSQLGVMQKITMGDLNDPLSIPLESVRKDTIVVSMLKNISDLENTEKEFSRTYLPGHKELQKVRQNITLAKDNLARHTQMLLLSLQKQNIETLTALNAEKEMIAKEIEINKGIALKNNEVLTQMNRINQELTDARRLRDQVNNEIQQYQFRQKLSGEPVTIVCSANTPDTTAGLSPRKRAGSVLLLGVLFSFMLIFGMEKMSKSDALAQQAYGMPMAMGYPQPMYGYPMMAGYPMAGNMPVGDQQSRSESKHVEILGRISGVAVDELDGKMNESMLYNLVHTYPNSPQAEQYREVSTTLLSRFGKTRQSLVVTGNETRSGKTILVCNLAHLLAQAGRSVLVVNANPASDKLSKAFATGRTMYADLVMTGKYNLAEFICKGQGSNVATLTLDLDNRPETVELEQAISALNWKLQSQFDWVIYDTTSIGYYDTDNILQVIGKAIFVSRGGNIQNRIVATEQIEQRGAVSLGCVEMPGSSHTCSYQNV